MWNASGLQPSAFCFLVVSCCGTMWLQLRRVPPQAVNAPFEGFVRYAATKTAISIIPVRVRL